ncbi:hypothetical protein OHA09_12430 [Streptomyces longwoodensis]|uniref:hypothetical protein n=2 Tax=Streptomyces longwoodensis TaxID=68231 RepID=UPI002E81846B|nr:hypothetical protein [Streptomyces longwoodensis]WTI45045.1 hypothetical protein OG547_11255 [Streptomyces longwoodensis]WUC57844.1 hypothetical protein OHA09_12430 [Streptomyces longwoodensis]
MNERKIMTAAFAMALAVICGLGAAFWRLARTGSVDQALATGGGVFIAVAMLAFVVLSYLRSD